jgi:hypothetical protein
VGAAAEPRARRVTAVGPEHGWELRRIGLGNVVGIVGIVGIVDLVGLFGLIEFVDLVGLFRIVEFVEFIRPIEFSEFREFIAESHCAVGPHRPFVRNDVGIYSVFIDLLSVVTADKNPHGKPRSGMYVSE